MLQLKSLKLDYIFFNQLVLIDFIGHNLLTEYLIDTVFYGSRFSLNYSGHHNSGQISPYS